MKELLTEVYRTTKKMSGIDPSKPGNLKQILVDDKAFACYINGLAESIENKKDRSAFKMLAENTRINLLENSMFAINPYESLTLPILRVFYPKLVAKEAVTVSPMDKPECVKAFIKATFTQAGETTKYSAPVVTTDISNGPTVGTPITATMAVPQSNFDVLGAIGITNTQAHLERDFQITGASEDNTSFLSVSIVPAVEGHFSASVTYANLDTDVLSGMVNYLNGTVTIASATGKTKYIQYTGSASLEENRINPAIQLTVEKIRLYAKDRQISANWTINMEQDMRALFDVSMQAEIVNLLGQQIALDIDREIINALLTANTRLNASNHTSSFARTAPVGYSWGNKYWHENILPVLNVLSAQIYTDTNIDAGNCILANPLDVSILEDLQGFNYTGTSSLDGDMGYRSATVAGGKWKVLTSAVVTAGTMLLVYKPQEELKSIFFYSPYVPAVLHPYPLGYTPSLTILSRYATALVRSNGICSLTIGA
jgi:hypothetical protein